MLNNVCLLCSRNNHSSEKTRLQNLYMQLEMAKKSADKASVEKAEKYCEQHRELKRLFHYTERCKYGLNCPTINSDVLQINRLGLKIVEDLVLLHFYAPQKMSYYLSFLKGTYPNVVRYFLIMR